MGRRAYTTKEFIEKSNKIHNNKYDYYKVIYTSANSMVIIVCPIHGEFKQQAYVHIHGSGCFLCGNNSYTEEQFLQKANEVHNNKYTYLNYTALSKKLTVICQTHGTFEQTGSKHLKGFGCRKCVHDSLRFSTEYFIDRANKVHNHKYDYSKTIYHHSHEEVIIICNKHGEFTQIAREHLKSHGCPACAHSNTYEEFIKKANKVHHHKYDYSKTNYIGCRIKITIVCPFHGEFKQTPEQHLIGTNCPKCSRIVSIKSQKWLDSIGIEEQNREKRVKTKNHTFVVDGLDKENKTVYEFYGDFWHGNLNRYDATDINKVIKHTFGFLYKKTMDREIEIKNSGYKIISIWESDFDG